jgi:hypothetical protein
MTSRKLDELAVDIDDAADVVDEIEADAETGTDAGEKLKELRNTLKNASDAIDEISEKKDD